MRRFLPAIVVVASLVLGATISRSDVASAAMQALTVFVNNDAANPVPVTQQGTANVNVTGGMVNLGSTPVATANRWGGGGCGAGVCGTSSTFPAILASSIVLTVEGNSGVDFSFLHGGTVDPVTHQYIGGVVVYLVTVSANSTTAIPLYDRILVDNVQGRCDNGCILHFALLGQGTP